MRQVFDVSVPDKVIESMPPDTDWERFWCKRMKRAMPEAMWRGMKVCDNCNCERASEQ